MQLTSNWPLPNQGIRFLTPQFLSDQLSQNPLTENLYPVAMGYYPKAQEHQMVRETHTSNLLIYCTAGRGTLMLEDKHHRIRAGDLIVLPEGLNHSYSSHRSYPWSIYWIHFDGHLAKKFLPTLRYDQPSTVHRHATAPDL